MPDPALSAAIAEAYASAPVDEVILHTVELHHPAFAVPVRVVRDRVSLSARLEASAPIDAGQVVEFAAYAFDLVPPDQTSAGAPQCVLEIDNVSPEILAQVRAAVLAGDPVQLIYRAYLSSDPLSGPENDPPLVLHLKSVSATPQRIRATAGFPDLLNEAFPRLVYDLDKFKGLLP
ncbi:MAG: DUF1833 family protein [Gemmobacter sp.]|uniref:DUF1833 family protein n=1 Tax=Gemmobacter sp. TaxID=1898957 RepID=UPI00391A020C